MNADGPILRDIHLPADPSWWPPAPGWWLLAAVAVVLLLVAAAIVRRRWRLRQWRRRVVRELEQIAARYDDAADSVRLVADISQLLRRASRLVDPAAVSLRGEAWLRFLDALHGGDGFSVGVGRCLLDGPYQRRVSIDAGTLLGLARSCLLRTLEGEVRHA